MTTHARSINDILRDVFAESKKNGTFRLELRRFNEPGSDEEPKVTAFFDIPDARCGSVEMPLSAWRDDFNKFYKL